MIADVCQDVWDIIFDYKTEMEIGGLQNKAVEAWIKINTLHESQLINEDNMDELEAFYNLTMDEQWEASGFAELVERNLWQSRKVSSAFRHICDLEREAFDVEVQDMEDTVVSDLSVLIDEIVVYTKFFQEEIDTIRLEIGQYQDWHFRMTNP